MLTSEWGQDEKTLIKAVNCKSCLAAGIFIKLNVSIPPTFIQISERKVCRLTSCESHVHFLSRSCALQWYLGGIELVSAPPGGWEHGRKTFWIFTRSVRGLNWLRESVNCLFGAINIITTFFKSVFHILQFLLARLFLRRSRGIVIASQSLLQNLCRWP